MAERNDAPTEQQHFAYCFQPIYYFARIAGQMPFTIIRQPPNSSIVKAKFYVRDFFWLAFSLCIHISYIRISILDFKSYKHKNSVTSTMYFGNLTLWFASLLLGIGVIASDVCNRVRIIRILNEFTAFDKEVRFQFKNK